jgi:hypothetical protein
MLVIGIISTLEEQYELRAIAEVWPISKHIRFIAQQQTHNKKRKK